MEPGNRSGSSGGLCGDSAVRTAGGGVARGEALSAATILTRVIVLLALLGLALSSLAVPPWGGEVALGGSLSGWRFCVDPGHGGSDAGAVGPTGLAEKDVNLAVALKLKDLLEAEGAEVLMTRYDDSYVSITQRWQMANAWGAHRFISIHHNAESDRSINYTVTLVSVKASRESMELANAVQAELVGEFGLGNSGVWKVDYCGVLNNTTMPAILTEASFISNPEQERRLRDDSYLQREAMAILRGIHMPSSISFALPRENRFSEGLVDVEIQLLGQDTLERLDLELDGKPVASRTSNPYRFEIDADALGDGTYSLRATARYKNGSTASATRDLIVANAARHWYFAEGTTREGFEEWLCVLNAGGREAVVEFDFIMPGGETHKAYYNVPAASRFSLNVNAEVGPDKDVAARVSSAEEIFVERAMYFNYKGTMAGGSATLGSRHPGTSWYFAEGTTRSGFEEWLTLANPGDEDALVTVEYLLGTGQGDNVVEEWLVPARSRATVNVNLAVGPDKDVSIRVTSDRAVVAERPMYFNYGPQGWRGGSCGMGYDRVEGGGAK